MRKLLIGSGLVVGLAAAALLFTALREHAAEPPLGGVLSPSEERPSAAAPTQSEVATATAAAAPAPDERRAAGAASGLDAPRKAWSSVLRVLDDADGAPIVDASVRVSEHGGSLAPWERELGADRDGGVELESPDGWPLFALASARGYEPRGRAIDARTADPLLRLRPNAGRVDGVVTADGGAVAAARAQVFDADGGVLAATTSDATGRFSLPRLPTADARLALVVTAQGWANETRMLPPLDAREPLALEFELRAGRTIRVRCETFDGRPLTGAAVCVDGGRHEPQRITDVRGETLLSEMPKTGFGLVARAAGWVQQRVDVAAEADEPIGSPFGSSKREHASVVMRMVPAPSVVGRIVAASGEALRAPAFATVHFVRADGLRSDFIVADRALEPVECRTDEFGAFECRELVPGIRYRFVVESPGFAPRSDERELVLAGEGRIDLGTVVLDVGRTLVGRVFDGAGAPVGAVGIRVAVPFADGAYTLNRRAATSDADGRFVLSAVPTDRLVVSAEQGALLAQTVVQPSGASVELVLRARADWTLTGTCADEAGGPVEGVELVVRELPEHAARPPVRATSDSTGRFSVRNLRALECSVTLSDASPYVLIGDEPRANVGEPSLELVVSTGRVVSGRAVLSNGAAPSNARVEWTAVSDGPVTARSARSDPSTGDFTLRVPPEYPGVLRLGAPGLRAHVLELPAGRDPIDLGAVTLAAATSMIVRCTTASKAPVPNVRVVCSPAVDDEPRREPLEGVTDPTGTFAVSIDPDCGWIVTIRWADASFTRRVTPSGAAVETVEFDSLAEPVWVKLRVQCRAGDALGGWRVVLAGTDDLRESRLDDTGHADFVGVAPGRYDVRVNGANDRPATSRIVQLPAGRTVYELEVEID